MKIKDGIVGLAVGDALGVPVEFSKRSSLEANPVTGMRSGGTWKKAAGTWSDDTSMCLATMGSIVNKKAIDYADIMQEFCEWYFNDKYSQNGTFDTGITTTIAIESYKPGMNPLECGGTGERENGNGSLMRILPLAFIKDISFETIEDISSLTHAHKRSRIACVLYIQIAKSMLKNPNLSIRQHIQNASLEIIDYYGESYQDELKHFQRIFDDDYSDGISSKGYVITTLEAAIYCLKNTTNYRDAVLKAVNLGEDTDTVAAVCGGLAGIYYGYEDIPVDWISEIDQIQSIIDLCENYEVVCYEYL